MISIPQISSNPEPFPPRVVDQVAASLYAVHQCRLAVDEARAALTASLAGPVNPLRVLAAREYKELFIAAARLHFDAQRELLSLLRSYARPEWEED